MKTATRQPKLSIPKVKNILVRYCPEFQGEETRYPEDSHLLKHFPKYYKNLSIHITRKNPLLLKIKKIKKLHGFTGHLEGPRGFPSLLWFSLFKSHQKGIEEIPEMEASYCMIQEYFRKLTIKQMKFFYNISKLHLSPINIKSVASDQWDLLSIYISNMRYLKRLKLQVQEENYDQVKSVIGRLDKMKRLLTTLKQLKFYVDGYDMDIQDLFVHKNFMSHLTSLEFDRPIKTWYPFLEKIPFVCKDLRHLSLCFQDFFSEGPEFAEFLVSLKNMPKLEVLDLDCEKNMREFLKVWKPQASLKSLKLKLDFTDMDFSTMNFESKDLRQYENFVQNWDNLQELDTLHVSLVFRNTEMMLFVRILMTMILKKVRKLKSLKCWMCFADEVECAPSSFVPVLVEQVPHLYESLEKFRVWFCDCYPLPNNVSFNLGALKAFKNLKKIKITGEGVRLIKIKEIVEQLERHKNSKLNLSGIAVGSKNDLKKILEEVSKAKRREESNLKMKLEFEFCTKPQGEEIKYLKKFCHVIESIKPIKGLLISLDILDCSDPPIEKMKAVMKSYPHLQNCIIIVRLKV